MNTNELSLLTAKTKRKTSINSIENYINNKYDEIALSHLKQSILSEVHATINEKIISIPKTDEVTYLQNHIDSLMSELYFLREELREKNNLIKILLNKTEEIKHVAIRNNKTLKDGQPSPTNNNQKLVVNDTSNVSNPMNESYYNNSTENITSTNHSAGLQIGRDECVSVGNNLHDSTSDSYKRTDNNNNINEITKANKNNDHHLGEKDQMKTKKLVVNEKKKVFVLGDSMVKHIQGWDITKKLENKHKVYIRQFAGSKIICMNDYVKPCIRENNPDHIIFHVGTNDIPTSKDPLAIAQSIVDLAKSVMNQDRGVTISGIIPRNDQWNNKVREVNDSLACMCENDNIPFIDHSGSIDPRKNLNNSKLHLNVKGSNKLRDNFVRYLKGFSS